MASMYLAEGVAWLGNANTYVKHRRSGCQYALLAHRLREADRLACDLAVSDTDFGTTSHRNLERAGFKMAYMPLTLNRPKVRP